MAANMLSRVAPDQWARVLTWIAFCVSCSSQAVPLDAKPGLWERTVVTQSELSPTAPKPDLSKIAPEERRKLEELMSGRVTTGRRTRVTEECITPEMLQQWSALAREAPGNACKRTIATENSKQIKVALSCDNGQTTGDIEYTASGDSLKGKISLVSHEREFDRIVTHEISSKWLRRECGDVKPPLRGPPVSRQMN